MNRHIHKPLLLCSRSGVVRRLHGFRNHSTYTWQNHLNSRSTSLVCDSLHEQIEFLFFSAGCWISPSFWSALTRKSVCQMSKYCASGGFIFCWCWPLLQCFSVRGESAARSPTCWDQRRQGGSNWRTFFFTRWLICHLIRSLVVSQERV